jgi:prevent-host-death family protein
MKRVSSAEMIRNFGRYSDAALAEPVIITKNGRDRLVLVSIEQFNLFQHALDAIDDAQSRRRNDRPKGAPRQNVAGRRAR